MIQKAIIIAGTKFGLRDYNRFGIEIFKKRGYAVEIWDFIGWINPSYYKNYKISDPIESNVLKKFSTKEESNQKLSELCNEDIVIDTFRLIETHNLSISKDVKIGVANLGKIPQMYAKTPSSILLKYLKNPFKLLKKSINHLLRFIKINFSYSFIIVDGKKSKTLKKKRLFHNSKLIYTHSYDYDCFLAENKKLNNKILKHNYAVFLDEGVFKHPDIDYLKISPVAKSSKIYYEELSVFFNKFEKLTNMEVVISLHPRVEKHENFGQRKIFKGNTINLVKNSSIVILHASTSISYAILYHKPTIFLDSINFSQDYSNTINIMANAINHKPIDISSNYEINEQNFLFDKSIYDRYKTNYIKESSSPDKPIWEIFCDYLDSLNA